MSTKTPMTIREFLIYLQIDPNDYSQDIETSYLKGIPEFNPEWITEKRKEEVKNILKK